jgi:hypothetical protein
MNRLEPGTFGETVMFKKSTTISLAAFASLGATAMSVESASATSIHFGFGHRGHHWNHGHHWRPHYGWGYRAPVYVSAPLARPCYFVRRGGGLFKVCPAPIYY